MTSWISGSFSRRTIAHVVSLTNNFMNGCRSVEPLEDMSPETGESNRYVKLWEDSQRLQWLQRRETSEHVSAMWCTADSLLRSSRREERCGGECRVVNTCQQLWPTKRDHLKNTHPSRYWTWSTNLISVLETRPQRSVVPSHNFRGIPQSLWIHFRLIRN